MKIAAGCFGCLAFLFLALTLATGILVSSVISFAPSDPTVATLAQYTSWIQGLNGSCCCLSGVLCIVLLAVGSMRGRDPIE